MDTSRVTLKHVRVEFANFIIAGFADIEDSEFSRVGVFAGCRNGSWSTLPGIGVGHSLRLWRRSATEIFTTTFGNVHRWDGTSWSTVPVPPVATSYPITGTANYIYVVGLSGAFRFNGQSWTQMPGEIGGQPAAIQAFTDSAVAVIAHRSTGSSLSFYDGERFWPVWIGDSDVLYSGIFLTERDIFLIGPRGYILHGVRK